MIWERHTLPYFLNKETELLKDTKKWPKVHNKDRARIQGVRIYSIVVSGKESFPQNYVRRRTNCFKFCGVFCWLPKTILIKTILKTLIVIRTCFVSPNKYVFHVTGVESGGVHWSTIPIKVFRVLIENISVEVEISYKELITCSPPPQHLDIFVCLHLWLGLGCKKDHGNV